MAAGLTALAAVLIGLLGRAASGRGDYCDVAMFDSLLPWCAHIAGGAIAGGDPPRTATQRSLGGAAFYQVYETADARHVVLGGREPKFVDALLRALDRPDLIAIGGLAAGEQSELISFLRRTFAARTRAEWVQWFKSKDVAFAPVLDFREALSSPELRERGLLIEFEGAHQIGPAIRFASTPWEPANAPEPGRA
jgi:crotonobetainyl-CoA:carnitine CoA-transferase CaiB-like acyl-CoA transferase